MRVFTLQRQARSQFARCHVRGVNRALSRRRRDEAVRGDAGRAICAAGAANCYALLRVERYGGLGDYFVLGLTLGLGFLAKYNFLFLATAFFVAGLTIRSFRARLLDYRILFSLVFSLPRLACSCFSR